MTSVSSHTHALSINPATGEQIGAYPYQSESELDAALERASRGFAQWKRQDISERAGRLVALAQVLRDNSEALARMITREMGKPVPQARGEIEKCAQLCLWYAEHGPAMLAPEATLVENDKARISTDRWGRSWQ